MKTIVTTQPIERTKETLASAGIKVSMLTEAEIEGIARRSEKEQRKSGNGYIANPNTGRQGTTVAGILYGKQEIDRYIKKYKTLPTSKIMQGGLRRPDSRDLGLSGVGFFNARTMGEDRLFTILGYEDLVKERQTKKSARRQQLDRRRDILDQIGQLRRQLKET